MRSARPHDEHTLRLCGLTADDDDDDGFPVPDADASPSHSSASSFRDYVSATAKVGGACCRSDSILWARHPPVNEQWSLGDATDWGHGLPPPRPPSAPPSPFPPPAGSSLEQRLKVFNDSVPYAPAIDPADRERLIQLLCKHQAAFEPLNARLPA
jgi:hypothetical protein